LKLYIAGVMGLRTFPEDLRSCGVRRGLVSFWDYLKQRSAFFQAFDYYRDAGDVFLDSGAFSAYTLGVQIVLEEYCAFIEERGLELYSNLDVIRDEKGTRANQEAMERRGLRPVPVFHLGEDWGYLEELLDGREYVALGVAATQGEKRCDAFLEGCFVRAARRWPRKIYGFGITTQRYLERYPFYSVDSASAIYGGGMGRVYYWRGRRLVSGDYKDRKIGARDYSLVDREGGRSEHGARRRNNIRRMLELEERVTELWRRRGVEWD
jgi:hypothetical protein